MKKRLKKDINGNNILRYQNMIKMEIDTKVCNIRHVTKCDKLIKKIVKSYRILVPSHHEDKKV
jgi:hypothetical protein